MNLFECERLHAKITEAACKARRKSENSISCQGCVGLGEPAQVPLPAKEEVVKKKKIECARSGCGYGVKKEGDYCKKHQEPETSKKLTDVIIDAKEPETAANSCDTGIVDINAGDELDGITAESFEPVAEETVREEVKEWVRESLEELEGITQPAPRPTGLAALLRTVTPPPSPMGY